MDTKTEILASSVIVMLLSIVRRSIGFACKRDRVLRNVAEHVVAPKGAVGRPSRSLTLAQAKKVITASEQQQRGLWIAAYLKLSMLTGVRTEEARVLRWEHVHLDSEEGTPPHVKVWRSVRSGGDTKTVSSRRTIALPLMVVRALRSWRDEQREERRRNDYAWEHISYVFGTRKDTPMDHGNVRRRMRDVVKDAALPDWEKWTPRELRHTFVSIMSSQGAAEELIADLVGHKLTSTTRRIYRHQLNPIITSGAELMDDAFDKR